MKDKIMVIQFVSFFFLFILIFCCSQQKAAWKGTIEEVDGIPLVKNPKEPVYTEDVCILEEELTIGETEGREEYMLSRIIDVAVDDAGNIYAADMKENQIIVFDRNGCYVRTIGRPGQGPGEFSRILDIQITPRNELMAYDRLAFKLTFFSLDGNYTRSLHLKGVQALRKNIRENVEGNYYVGTIEFQGQYGTNAFRSSREVREYGSDFTFIKTIFKDKFRTADVPLRHDMLARFPSSGLIICGFTDTYEFRIINPDGEIVRRVLKLYDPIGISDEEKMKRGLADVKSVPKYFPAFQDFSMDEDGRIFVQTFESQADENKFYYDVFDPDGKYVAKISLNALPACWKNGKMYTIKYDEQGCQYIKRYELNWKI
jgi:hypothetical protein